MTIANIWEIAAVCIATNITIDLIAYACCKKTSHVVNETSAVLAFALALTAFVIVNR